MGEQDERRKTQVAVGCVVDAAVAKKMCRVLDFSCELASGNFEWQVDGNCTVFIAPRRLGEAKTQIAKAAIDGFRVGLFG